MEVIERLAAIETDIKHISKNVAAIRTSLDNYPNKYALKWNEYFTKAIIVAAIGAIFAYYLNS